MVSLEDKIKNNGAGIKMIERRLITAALPYINNVPHLGHIVGSHLPADIFARYCRAKGYETLFIGGTDENGSTSEIAAKKLNKDINLFSEVLYKKHKEIYDWFNISYDNFSRTSKEVHHSTVQEFFKEVDKNGFITREKMKVLYSPEEDMFLPDRYVVGECPKCGYTEANGDQCEKCTSVFDSIQLKNPRSAITGNKLEIRETEHLFLDLDKLSPSLKKWINKQDQWRLQVRNLALGWINEGLKKRCITRDLKNGIKVPVKGFENKVFYVWFEAPIGYVSMTKEVRPKNWEDFWKNPKAGIYNFLGKDNIPFHTIFWPGMIIANGELSLPKNVIGLQYLNYEGKKFSKSKGIGVFCENLSKLGLLPDVWRSYLSQIIPETDDAEFKWKEFQERVNSDLIGNYGNLVNRIIKFIETKLGGKIEQPKEKNLQDIDRNLVKKISEYKSRIETHLENAEIRKAYSEILSLSSEGNKYINDTGVWKIVKTNPQRANDILYYGALLLKCLATFSAPYLPKTSEEVWKQLNLDGTPSQSGAWDSAVKGFGKKHYIGNSKILFKKIEDTDLKEYKEIASKGVDLDKFFE